MKQAVLGHLSSDRTLRSVLGSIGFELLATARPVVQLFSSYRETSTLLHSEPVVLYIPRSFNHPAVDAVIRLVVRTAPPTSSKAVGSSSGRSAGTALPADVPLPPVTDVIVIPIHITMTPITAEKRRRALRFFNRHHKWTADHPTVEATYEMVFIDGADETVREERKEEQYGAVGFGEWRLRLDDVSEALASTVRRRCK